MPFLRVILLPFLLKLFLSVKLKLLPKIKLLLCQWLLNTNNLPIETLSSFLSLKLCALLCVWQKHGSSFPSLPCHFGTVENTFWIGACLRFPWRYCRFDASFFIDFRISTRVRVIWQGSALDLSCGSFWLKWNALIFEDKWRPQELV